MNKQIEALANTEPEEISVSPSWKSRNLLWLSLFIFALLAFYWDTLWSMITIWERSETYAHGYVIAPISLWLVWTKRQVLAQCHFQPVFWTQLLLIPGGIVWLLSYLVDVIVLQQLALVGIIIVGIWSIVGHRIAAVVAFPLGFLILAVPMGEDIVPPMMEFTATSTVWLIKLTGIPVYREGLYFTLPTGNWSVVEACSGVRYLIASITLGLLYSHLTYRSRVSKALFILASILVPILANSARAYIIVMLGHMSGMTIATGVDHLIYGWLFFGLVMLILFWVGSFWREDLLPETAEKSQEPIKSVAGVPSTNVLFAVLSATTLAVMWPTLVFFMESKSGTEQSYVLQAPDPAGAWQSQANSSWDWSPAKRGAAAEVSASYVYDSHEVVVYLQQYLQQKDGGELISGKPGQFVDESGPWRIGERGKTTLSLGNENTRVDWYHINSSDTRLILLRWYRIGDRYTANPYVAKLYQALESATFGRIDSSHIVIATPAGTDNDGENVLEAFAQEHRTEIERVLDASVGESSP